MSATADVMLQTAKSAGHDEALKAINQMRVDLVLAFGDFINPLDLKDLDACMVDAIKAKSRQYMATTPKQAREAVDIYEACLESMKMIGDKYELVGRAKAGKLVRSVAHTIISGAFAVGGAVLQAGLGVALPGLGSLLGAGLNMGLQHVVSYFLERSEAK